MQRQIGRRLRGAGGATWLERFASLTAGVICAWVSSHVCSVVGSPSRASRGDVKFGATASGGADGWNAPAVALRGGGESKVSSEAIAKQEHLPTHKLTRTVEENDTSLVYAWRNPAGAHSHATCNQVPPVYS